jgi:predicted secreted protein
VNFLDSGEPVAPSNPTPLSSLPSGPLPPAYQDRSTGLLVFGIVEIAGGALAALALPFMLLGIVLGRKAPGGPPPLGSIIPGAVTYAVAAVVLVTLGIGAIQARRWAWALNLILSWIWLIMGTLVTGLLIFVLPSGFLAGMKTASTQNPNAPPLSPAVGAVIVTFMIVLFAMLFIVLPLAFLLFYRSKNVEETCKHRDPVERWTDRRPLPVTAVALLAAAGSLYYLIISFTTPLFPLFGRYLTGLPGGIACLTFAVVDAFIAVAILRMNVVGWWVALTAMIIRIVSAAVTYGRADLMQAYAKLGWSAEKLETMGNTPMFRSHAFLWVSLVFMVLYLGFLIWLKRYFRRPAPPGYTGMSELTSTPTQPGS